MASRREMITQMLEQFPNKMGGGGLVFSQVARSYLHLILNSLDQADQKALAARRRPEDG